MADIVETEGVMGGQPRIEGRRISVLQIAKWVRTEGIAPETVASEFDLELADVYRALVYSHENPDRMQALREERQARIEASKEDALTPATAESTE